jgi:hypothetical protein
MKPWFVKRRKFLGSIVAGLAGGVGIRALIATTIVQPPTADRNPSTISVEPHPLAVPRKRTRPHEA